MGRGLYVGPVELKMSDRPRVHCVHLNLTLKSMGNIPVSNYDAAEHWLHLHSIIFLPIQYQITIYTKLMQNRKKKSLNN